MFISQLLEIEVSIGLWPDETIIHLKASLIEESAEYSNGDQLGSIQMSPKRTFHELVHLISKQLKGANPHKHLEFSMDTSLEVFSRAVC